MNKYRILFVVCITSALVPFSGNSINLALPAIAADLQMDAVSLGWVVTAMMLPSAIFQIPLGKLGDIIGRKRLLLTGVVLFSAAAAGCALVTAGAWLLVLRAVQGVASAMLFGVSMAIITSVFPPQERGKALGINTGFVYFSLAAGPFFGGMLTHYLGWRSIFWVTAGAGLVAVAGILLFMKAEWTDAKDERFDWRGTLVYAVAITGIVYGFAKLPATVGFSALAVGLVALAGFVFLEKRHTTPLFNINMFMGNRVFRMSLVAALINYAATFAVGFMLSLYLQYIRGFDAQQAGWLLLVQPVFMAVFSPLAGRWSDRYNAGRIATVGMAVIVVCLALLILLTPHTPLPLLIAVLLTLGMGFALFSSPNVNVIMGSVERRYLGLASATAGTMRLVGQAISMGITMMMLSLFIGYKQLAATDSVALMRCLRYAFAVFTLICILGVYTSAVRKENRQPVCE
ncbi:MAG: MFS transporter [Bacteroidales bacterium]|jgi:MFS family permease|nr:MFS transporter [Bacteroidales bacterium]